LVLSLKNFPFLSGTFQRILGQEADHVPHPYSSLFGILLMGIGTLLGALAFIRYRNTSKQIDANAYEPAMNLTTALAFLVLAIGIVLIVYLATGE
jgi:uncharacterized membrane protein YidH (DUF202 family)